MRPTDVGKIIYARCHMIWTSPGLSHFMILCYLLSTLFSRVVLPTHAAFLDISKIEPRQIPQKFHNMDDQSTFLNILEEKLGAITRNLWS